MGKTNVEKVRNKHQMHDFIHVVDQIYKGCEQYVPDLVSDVKDILTAHHAGKQSAVLVQPFVAYMQNRPVGRIVGIVNKKANEKWKTQNVRFSMIEFIDDCEVAKALLDQVAQWGREQGMKKIHGPLGITDFDKEGMLVEDFQLLGSMNTIYNPEYYPKHLEALGFVKEVDWVQVRVDIPEVVPPKYQRVAQYDREQAGLRVIKVTDKDIVKGGYGRRIFNLLNEAYQPIFGFTSLSDDQVDGYVKKYLALVDKQLMPIIVNEKDEVVGVAICMGCMSEAMRKANGRLWPFGWYQLLKALKWKRADNAEMLLIAVRPDLQGLGVNALFFDDLIPVFNKYGFKWAETGPQLENNVRELTQWKPLHPQYVKRRRCYCKDL